jgi:hypothetical protein
MTPMVPRRGTRVVWLVVWLCYAVMIAEGRWDLAVLNYAANGALMATHAMRSPRFQDDWEGLAGVAWLAFALILPVGVLVATICGWEDTEGEAA